MDSLALRAAVVTRWLRRRFPAGEVDAYPMRAGAAALWETPTSVPLGAGHHDVYRFKVNERGFRYFLDVACPALERYSGDDLEQRLEWQEAVDLMRSTPGGRWVLNGRGELAPYERTERMPARHTW